MMSIWVLIVVLTTFYGIGFSLTMAAAHWIGASKSKILPLVFVNLSIIFLFLTLLYSRLILNFPWLFSYDFVAYLALGPLLTLYFEEIMLLPPRSFRYLILYFSPVILVAVLLTIFRSTFSAIVEPQLQIFFESQKIGWIYTQYFLGTISIWAYLTVFVVQQGILSSFPDPDSRPAFFVTFLGCVLTPIFVAVGCAIHQVFLHQFSAILGVAVMVVAFLAEFKNPQFFFLWGEVLQKLKYERSHLKNVSVSDILDQLKDLMEKKKIYTDKTLSLASLAERVNLTAHQLSQLLNEQLDQNFNSYINGFRVKAAREYLMTRLDLKIEAIASMVGYSSMASFFTQFKKETGKTPHQFRKIYTPEQ